MSCLISYSYVQIEAVVRRIKWLTASSSAAKVLVFSTWQDVLDVIAHALDANRLPFAHARGRKGMQAAIQQFKTVDLQQDTGRTRGNTSSTGQVQTLLLLVKQGGNGLNLTGEQRKVPVTITSLQCWLKIMCRNHMCVWLLV